MRNLGIVVASAVAAMVPAAALLGIVAVTEGAPAAKQLPVTAPIAEPHASVKPDVAREMNGKRGNVDIAGKIKMHPAKPVPSSLIGNGKGNGCLKNYGGPGQCLPIMSPMQQQMPEMDHPWTCPDVKALFPDGVSVHGADTLGLDTNGDRTACGPGDG